jgi:branched-chain amino acid transport system ATP-binding protein
MLEINDVHAYYGTSHILHGISLKIDQGELVALLGRNGAGKTTTICTIMGLVQARQGQIFYKGKTISNLKPFQIARLGIGYVPEERAIFSHLTVIENLRIGALARKRKDNNGKKEWTLERVFETFPGLYERRAHRGAHLSGGEQQMLAIARALMTQPDLILLDEPSEGLAPLIVNDLERVIREILVEGYTVLLVEQNIAMCAALASRNYIIDHGKIVYHGTNEEFLKNEEVQDLYLSLRAVGSLDDEE